MLYVCMNCSTSITEFHRLNGDVLVVSDDDQNSHTFTKYTSFFFNIGTFAKCQSKESSIAEQAN